MPTRRGFLKGLGIAAIAGAFCPIELAPKLFTFPEPKIEAAHVLRMADLRRAMARFRPPFEPLDKFYLITRPAPLYDPYEDARITNLWQSMPPLDGTPGHLSPIVAPQEPAW